MRVRSHKKPRGWWVKTVLFRPGKTKGEKDADWVKFATNRMAKI